MHELEASTEIANEFIAALVQRDTPETGYCQLILERFKGMEFPLEESVLEELADKLIQVEEFSVAKMYELPN